MEISSYFKSIIDQDKSPVVICDTDHTVIYMNPSAVERYAAAGGKSLVGKSLLNCHKKSGDIIKEVLNWFAQSTENNSVHTFYNEKENKDVYMVALRDDDLKLIGYYEKHEYRNRDNTEFNAMK